MEGEEEGDDPPFPPVSESDGCLFDGVTRGFVYIVIQRCLGHYVDVIREIISYLDFSPLHISPDDKYCDVFWDRYWNPSIYIRKRLNGYFLVCIDCKLVWINGRSPNIQSNEHLYPPDGSQEMKEAEEKYNSYWQLFFYPILANNICFVGDGRVLLKDGSLRLVRHLLEGDLVQGGNGIWNIVRAKHFFSSSNSRSLVDCGGFHLTSGHPIFLKGEWKKSRESFPVTKTRYCGPLYNFELDPEHHSSLDHTLVVEGVPCATLGCKTNNRIHSLNPLHDHLWGTGYSPARLQMIHQLESVRKGDQI